MIRNNDNGDPALSPPAQKPWSRRAGSYSALHGAADAVEPDLGGGAWRSASRWERMVALCKFEHRVKSTIWFDTATPWSELDWVGNDVSLGETVLRIRDRTKRCQATTANRHNGERDIDILRVLSTWGHQDFRVYAKVIHTGSVALSDQVKVL